MASQYKASPISARFGQWLIAERTKRRLVKREVAAAIAMDGSHYGKLETGRRWPTPAQIEGLARLFGIESREVHRRVKAARLLADCEGDPELLMSVVGLVQEEASHYGDVNNVSATGVKREGKKK